MTVIQIGTFTHEPRHADVVCPPYQSALCICGHYLDEHAGDDLDRASDIGDRCPEDGYFTPAAGETLDCPYVTDCDVCSADVCEYHSTDEIVSVGPTHHVHHRDCLDQCRDCRGHMDALAEAGWRW